VDAAPLSADRDREAGLVDHVGYRDEVYTALDRGDAELLYLSRHARAAALRAAGRADDVKAVLLRVDSTGGSYVASDVIWREVGQLRAHGKPVVASMGDVAGSGGYFVAMGADAIVAQPGTLTG